MFGRSPRLFWTQDAWGVFGIKTKQDLATEAVPPARYRARWYRTYAPPSIAGLHDVVVP